MIFSYSLPYRGQGVSVCLPVSLFGLTLFPIQRTARQKAPGRDTVRLKNWICESAVVRCSSGKAFTFELHTY